MVYDGLHRVDVAIDSFGNRSTTIFEPAGQTVAAVNALGDRATMTYDAADPQQKCRSRLGVLIEIPQGRRSRVRAAQRNAPLTWRLSAAARALRSAPRTLRH